MGTVGIECEDGYAPQDSGGAFRLTRHCEVAQLGPGDSGFSTRFGLTPTESRNARSFLNYEYFAPATWYQQNGYNPATGNTDFTEAGSIADDFSDTYFWVRETRLALPVFAIRNNSTGSMLSITHLGADLVATSSADELDPSGKATDTFGRTSHTAVSDDITVGSLGVHKSPVPTVDFVYPASEGEATYVQTSGATNTWSRRAQPILVGAEHAKT